MSVATQGVRKTANTILILIETGSQSHVIGRSTAIIRSVRGGITSKAMIVKKTSDEFVLLIHLGNFY